METTFRGVFISSVVVITIGHVPCVYHYTCIYLYCLGTYYLVRFYCVIFFHLIISLGKNNRRRIDKNRPLSFYHSILGIFAVNTQLSDCILQYYDIRFSSRNESAVGYLLPIFSVVGVVEFRFYRTGPVSFAFFRQSLLIAVQFVVLRFSWLKPGKSLYIYI